MKITKFDPNYTWKLGDTTLSQGGGVTVDTGNSGSTGGGGGSSLTVQEVDGSPTVVATEIDVPNGSLTVAGTVATLHYVQPFGGGVEDYQTIAALGATYTLDLANGNGFDATLTADCTLTFAGATAGTMCSFMLLLRQDGTGGWTTTWPGSVIWAGGSAPTLDTTPSTASVLTFFTLDGGTTWYGFSTGTTLVFSTTDGVTTVDPTTELTFVGATLTDLGGGNAEVTFSGSGGGQHILLADGRATPFAFTDLLQMDDGSDFMWSD